MSNRLYYLAFEANATALASRTRNVSVVLLRLFDYGVISEAEWKELENLAGPVKQFNNLLELLECKADWSQDKFNKIISALKYAGNIAIANDIERSAQEQLGVQFGRHDQNSYLNLCLSDQMLRCKIVEILIQDTYLVADWKKFYQQHLMVVDPGVVQLTNGFRSFTLSVYEIFGHMIERWVSTKSKGEATIGNLINSLTEGQYQYVADSIVEHFQNVNVEGEEPMEMMEIDENHDWIDTLKSLTYIQRVMYGFMFKAEDKSNNYSTVKFIFPAHCSDPSMTRAREIDEVLRRCRALRNRSETPLNIVNSLSYSIRTFLTTDLDNLFGNPSSLFGTDGEAYDELAKFKARANRQGGIEGICIQMELYGPSLRSWLDDVWEKKIVPSDKTRVEIANGIIEGVKFLHNNRILHRDLRPENIYFSVPTSEFEKYQLPVKIGEFGVSRQVEGDSSQTLTLEKGTQLYRAPEVDNETYGVQADLYSLGLILWEIFQPMPRLTQNLVYKLVRDKDVSLVQENAAVPNLKEVIIGLTKKDKLLRTPFVNEVTLNYNL